MTDNFFFKIIENKHQKKLVPPVDSGPEFFESIGIEHFIFVFISFYNFI